VHDVMSVARMQDTTPRQLLRTNPCGRALPTRTTLPPDDDVLIDTDHAYFDRVLVVRTGARMLPRARVKALNRVLFSDVVYPSLSLAVLFAQVKAGPICMTVICDKTIGDM
jgi:hypothetical protein